MTPTPGALSLAASVARDARRAWRPLLVFEVLFKLLEAWLLLPAVAAVLSRVLGRAGYVAVTNTDVLAFFLSPLGLVYAAVFGLVAVTLLWIEQAALMAIAADPLSAGRMPGGRALLAGAGTLVRVLGMGAVQLVLVGLAAIPFAAVAGLTYWLLLSRHDINFYLETRPPSFWIAGAIGGVIGLAAGAVGLWLFVRWAFALPVLLFEGRSPLAALRTSRDRVSGAGWRIGAILLSWQLGALILGLGLQAGLRQAASVVLKDAGQRPIASIAGLLMVQAGLVAVASFVGLVGHALLTRRLYLDRSQKLGVTVPDARAEVAARPSPDSPWVGRLVFLSVGIALLTPLIVWADLPRQLKGRPPVKVTAHRGHSLAAPENTLSAVRKAIDSGADYAEIDVQQTSDGVVVLLHDGDLKRVAGVGRSVTATSFDEARKLDVGAWFAPEFAGERIPTLVEVINLARGRIRLNIELKVSGPDRELAREVARLVHEQDFESECLITSFNYDALRELKEKNDRLRVGLIVAKSLGNVTLLKLDALSVLSQWLTDPSLRAAHGAGMEVHVWTVNDPAQMTGLIKRGVDNIITDDPDTLIRVRDDWANLSGAERLVLAAKLLLGLNP